MINDDDDVCDSESSGDKNDGRVNDGNDNNFRDSETIRIMIKSDCDDDKMIINYIIMIINIFNVITIVIRCFLKFFHRKLSRSPTRRRWTSSIIKKNPCTVSFSLCGLNRWWTRPVLLRNCGIVLLRHSEMLQSFQANGQLYHSTYK